MENPFSAFQEWGRIGGRIRQRRLLKAKSRRNKAKPKPKVGRPRGMSRTTSARNLEMRRLFLKESVTLQDLGVRYGITRERVRQILKAQGVENVDGALSKTRLIREASASAKKERKKTAKREKQCLEFMGCSTEAFFELTGKRWLGWNRLPREATGFVDQRKNASTRKIAWSLSFPEWWECWQKSGRYPERGRGQGKYVMSRYGDTGAYEPGNVVIIPSQENNSEKGGKINPLPMGVSRNKIAKKYTAQKMVGGRKYRLGSFATAEEAHQAYLDFDPRK